MQRDENLVYTNNGQRYGMSIVSGWMFSYVTVRPGWSTGRSSRPDADHSQD